MCGATHGTPRVAQQPCAGPKGPVGSHVLAERGGRWQLGPTDPKPGAWARAPLMAEGRHPQYLSKGRGLPRRLDTTASQCWDARRDTLCCAACRTCSSHVSCSLERSTLTISGTFSWSRWPRSFSRQLIMTLAAREQFLSVSPRPSNKVSKRLMS